MLIESETKKIIQNRNKELFFTIKNVFLLIYYSIVWLLKQIGKLFITDQKIELKPIRYKAPVKIAPIRSAASLKKKHNNRKRTAGRKLQIVHMHTFNTTRPIWHT